MTCKSCGIRPAYNPASRASGRCAIYRDHCLDCARITHAARAYIPLDELLEQKPVKILRTLRRFRGWVDRADLYEALSLPEHRSEPQLVGAYHQMLTRLLRSRFVERSTAKANWGKYTAELCSYRITPAGLADLERRMRHAQIGVVASDAELVEPEPQLRRRRVA